MKGADLLLRNHQQKWLQDKLEMLTLKLNYSSLFRWYAKNLNSFMIRVVGLVSLVLIVLFLHNALNVIFETAIKSNYILFLLTLGIAIFINFRSKPFQINSFEYLAGKDIKENKKQYSLILFFKRCIRVLLIYFVVIAFVLLLYQLVISLFDKYYLQQNLPVFIFSLISVIPISLDFLGILISLVIVLILSITVAIFHFLLWILEEICWRIIEYNKGAFAAINVIITIILGVVEVYLKTIAK